MKNLSFVTVLAGALLVGAVPGHSQVAVGVDPTKTWYGYMNVYNLPANGGGYLWGSPWALADLPATFSSSTLTLAPNTGTYNPADPYWVNPDGSGAKQMEANLYVESSSLGGNTISFSGMTLGNTLAPGYYVQAFIKEFTPTYGWVGWDFIPLVGGTTFNVSRAIGAGNIAQYGFVTIGPNANPATVGSLGSAVISVIPEPTGAALLGCWLLLALCRQRR